MKQHLAHIAVVVRDYDEAIAYYTNTLGFKLIEDTVLSETEVKPDTNKRPLLRNKMVRTKQGFKLGPWIIGGIIGLGGLIFLAWRKFKNKIKA